MSGGRMQVNLQPAVLQWARQRADFTPEDLAKKLNVKPERIFDWEQTGKISIAQLNKVARYTHTPLGFLYLPKPPQDVLPIPDFRVIDDRPPAPPSPDLLDTIYSMQRRQEWLRDELIEEGVASLPFVNSENVKSSPSQIAGKMRTVLGVQSGFASSHPTWEKALVFLRKQIEKIGVIVVLNGVVGNNTYRKLDLDEFRGFVLVDEFAPLIFINNVDYKSAQMFTIVHEFAHLWIGADGVSNFKKMEPYSHETELFCNAVAAEFLVPEAEIRKAWIRASRSDEPFLELARQFKVSTIVCARRALDLALITRDQFFEFHKAYLVDERRQARKRKPGGDFWNNQYGRISERFGSAVVRAVKEGRLLYREAYRLTGLKPKTFDSFVTRIGD